MRFQIDIKESEVKKVILDYVAKMTSIQKWINDWLHVEISEMIQKYPKKELNDLIIKALLIHFEKYPLNEFIKTIKALKKQNKEEAK